MGRRSIPQEKVFPQQEKYDPTSFKGTQAQDDLPPQDHKLKGKDKVQEEIDAFEEAPKALWSSGFPRLHQVLLHQVRLQLQGFPSR